MRAIACALAAVVVAVGALVRCADAPAPPKPNVLLVVIDTTRADRCSVNGYARRTTPSLDRLAADGIVFEQAWSPSSWTLPAHAGLFTGRGPLRLGLADGTVRALPPDVPTVAELLHGAGWRTGCFSANAWISPATGLSRGFDVCDELYRMPKGPSAIRVFGAAFQWISERERSGESWFAFVNVMEPHAPYIPPNPWRKEFMRPGASNDVMNRAASLRLPESGVLDARAVFGDEVLAAASDLYDAEIASADAELGSFVESLRALGAGDDTWIIVCSDHGEGLGDHGWIEHAAWLHPELLHVPVVVRPPRGTTARRVQDVVRLEDVAPTILEACGVKSPAPGVGKSLLGDTSDRFATAMHYVRPDFRPEILALPLGGDPEPLFRLRRTIRRDRWFLECDDAGGTVLYDVSADPGGRTNVAAAHPDVVRKLRAELDDTTTR